MQITGTPDEIAEFMNLLKAITEVTAQLKLILTATQSIIIIFQNQMMSNIYF